MSMAWIRQPGNFSDKTAYDNPLMTATFISTAVRERNPFTQGVREIWQGVRKLLGLRRNMKLAGQRLEILESRLAQVQACIDAPYHQGVGERLDKLR